MTAGVAERPYLGSAFARVQASGRVRLPDLARRVLERHPSTLFVGLHPTAPCLIVFDGRFQQQLREDIDAVDPHERDARLARLRRVFASGEETGWPCDHLRLPDLARRTVGIGAEALFVGIGGAMELWAPEAARASGDEVLGALAAAGVGARRRETDA